MHTRQQKQFPQVVDRGAGDAWRSTSMPNWQDKTSLQKKKQYCNNNDLHITKMINVELRWMQLYKSETKIIKLILKW